MLKKVFFCLCVVLVITFHSQAQTSKNKWVDSVFSTLGIDEKIGQLFMVPVYARTNGDYLDEIEEAIESHHIGGVIFMDGGPMELANLTNRFQKMSPVPLLTGIDAACGLGKNIDSMITFPQATALGAIADDSLIYEMAVEIAREMKELDIHINFAPTAELASVNKIDTTGYSFGDNRVNVAGKALAFMRGLQDNGVMACAKHFPLQGLTIMDVKKDELPVVNAYIDSASFYPYQKLFANNIKGVLPASTDFPLFYAKKKSIKRNKYSPALLSSIYAGAWLQKKLGYQGLIFVNIPDILSKYKGGDAEVLAFKAGNDVILFPENLNASIRKLRRLLRREEKYEVQLDSIVKRILAVKYDAGLDSIKMINTDNLYERLNPPAARMLNQRLHEKAVTIIRNKQLLPVKILEDQKIATVSIGAAAHNIFTRYADKYQQITHFAIRDPENIPQVQEQLKNYDLILVGLFSKPTPTEGVILTTLRTLQYDHNVIVTVFDSPAHLKELNGFSTVLQAYNDSEEMQQTVAQVIFGSLGSSGHLPLTVSDSVREGQGIEIMPLQRLGYTFPEDVGMDSKELERIGNIAAEAIRLKATPGCHVLVARNGKIIYDQSFGSLTYAKTAPVTDTTIYDLASLTKVTATLQAVMFMVDRRLIDINKKVSYYLPEMRNSNKKDITIRDILTHQAGLLPFLPFWTQTMRDTVFLPEYYSRVQAPDYPLEVAARLYGSVAMRDSLWNWIIKSPVREKISRTPYDYRYSDMGFHIMQHLAERVLNQPLDDFLRQNLYDPLGAVTTGYLPLHRFSKAQIAPTENDQSYRRELLVGTVHDQGAAMMGGVAGHAGLFSDANDLAKLAQMLLQQGYYGGIQYYKPETVKLFTSRQFETSRRGLGWDKPIQSDKNSPASWYASPETFGHTGFTGTCIWVDPVFKLVYIFLSNRVYPDMTNNKLLSINIRSRIQDVIYQSIFSYCRQHDVESGDGYLEKPMAGTQ